VLLEEGIDRGFCLLLRSEDVPKEEAPVAVYTPYVGGCGPYRDRCDAVASAGYEGFHLNKGKVP
jgi:hypothetical protein